MVRRCACIALAVMLVGLSSAHAADTTLTLACQGTVTVGTTGDEKPEPVSMGIIVNFTKQTVHGFGYPGMTDYPVNIHHAARRSGGRMAVRGARAASTDAYPSL